MCEYLNSVREKSGHVDEVACPRSRATARESEGGSTRDVIVVNTYTKSRVLNLYSELNSPLWYVCNEHVLC